MVVLIVIFWIALFPISPVPISYVLMRTEQYGLKSVKALVAVYAPVIWITKGNSEYAMFCYWQHKSLERAFGRTVGYPGFIFDDEAIKTIQEYEQSRKR